jgi:hypothetical protein
MGENIIFRNGGGDKCQFEPKYRPLVLGDVDSHHCIPTRRQQHSTYGDFTPKNKVGSFKAVNKKY